MLQEGKFFERLDPYLGRFVVSAGPVPERLARGCEPESFQSLPEVDVENLVKMDLEKVTGEHTERLEQTVVYNVAADFDQQSLEPVVKAMVDYQITVVDEKLQAPSKTGKASPYQPD